MNAGSLFEHFSIINDPRQSWKIEHKLFDTLLGQCFPRFALYCRDCVLNQTMRMVKGMNIDPNLIIDALLPVLGDKLELSYLFGSYASGRATEDSDIDLAILPRSRMKQEEIWVIAQKLSIRLGRDVDLINLMYCNTVLSMQVVEEGKLLFDPNHKAPFVETNIYRMCQDLQLSRQDNLASFKQCWTN